MSTDDYVWLEFTKTVTPLGQPKASQPSVPNVIKQKTLTNKLDLHGLTVNEAYITTMDFVKNAQYIYSSVIVITGMSGIIFKEFPKWFEKHSLVRKIEHLNNCGKFRIYFKKK
jgi:DNA-nicking Smr family endonuclease